MSRFSQLYLERGQPTRDSERFRNRLAAYFEDKFDNPTAFACSQAYERETGSVTPRSQGYIDFGRVFKQAELRDLLDAITIVHDLLVSKRILSTAHSWRQFVARVMHEENVGYQVDDDCVVHYHVDEEFERNRAACMAAVELPQLGAVRAAFEDAYRHLDADPQDTKAAARSMFESLEIIAKLIVPTADRLTRNLCVQKLKEACLAVAPQDTTEQAVLGNLFSSLGYWVEAVHDYRHGQRAQEEVAPSEEAAVLIISGGTAFLRQLALSASRMPHITAATS
jgi:hypothetical protein